MRSWEAEEKQQVRPQAPLLEWEFFVSQETQLHQHYLHLQLQMLGGVHVFIGIYYLFVFFI